MSVWRPLGCRHVSIPDFCRAGFRPPCLARGADGLGWGLEQSADGAQLWQWGSNPGYRAFVLAVPGSGDGLVLLTNSDAGMKLVEPLVRAALPGEHKVLRSPFLTAGVLDALCEILRVRL